MTDRVNTDELRHRARALFAHPKTSQQALAAADELDEAQAVINKIKQLADEWALSSDPNSDWYASRIYWILGGKDE